MKAMGYEIGAMHNNDKYTGIFRAVKCFVVRRIKRYFCDFYINSILPLVRVVFLPA